MFFKRKVSADGFTSLIGEGTSFKGDTTFAGTLKIEGSYDGDLRGATDISTKGIKDCLVTTEKAVLKGNRIDTFDAIFAGEQRYATIAVEDTLRLLSTARIFGATIYYRHLEIEQGALLHECKLIHLDHSSKGEQV